MTTRCPGLHPFSTALRPPGSGPTVHRLSPEAARRLLDEHEALLALDEVRLGRQLDAGQRALAVRHVRADVHLGLQQPLGIVDRPAHADRSSRRIKRRATNRLTPPNRDSGYARARSEIDSPSCSSARSTSATSSHTQSRVGSVTTKSGRRTCARWRGSGRGAPPGRATPRARRPSRRPGCAARTAGRRSSACAPKRRRCACVRCCSATARASSASAASTSLLAAPRARRDRAAGRACARPAASCPSAVRASACAWPKSGELISGQRLPARHRLADVHLHLRDAARHRRVDPHRHVVVPRKAAGVLPDGGGARSRLVEREGGELGEPSAITT